MKYEIELPKEIADSIVRIAEANGITPQEYINMLLKSVLSD